MVTDLHHGQFSVPEAERTEHPIPQPAARAASLRETNRELLTELRSQIRALREEHARFHALVGPAGALRADKSAERTWPEYGLTGREIEVARLLAEGRRNMAIAGSLGISPHTARHHTQRVLAKLGVHSRAEAGAKLRG